MSIGRVLGLMALLSASFTTSSRAEPLELFIDADYSISAAAARSIELGVRTALEEVDYQLGGHPVVVVPMDHRGNVKRSRRTMQTYLESDQALALIGGMHSPPYLTHRDFINQNSVLSLLPWSAAGPITRASEGDQNWIFRLSVDDTLSGNFLVQQAVETGGCQKIALILLDTGWGRANHKTLTSALENRGMSPADVQFFPTSIANATARSLADKVAKQEPDCGILLANWDDGARVVNALHDDIPNLRLFSHWGIMGGEFTERVPHTTRTDMQISVLQTCGLRREKEGSAVLKDALAAAGVESQRLADLSAPTGFVHGYDLVRLVIAAAEQAATQADWGGSIADKRVSLRGALENLQSQVAGILNTYDHPFQPFSSEAPAAHEALGADDLCMARFSQDGSLEDAG